MKEGEWGKRASWREAGGGSGRGGPGHGGEGRGRTVSDPGRIGCKLIFMLKRKTVRT